MKIKNLKMKKLLLLVLTILLTTSSVVAQQQKNRQKIMLLKISYITDALNLTQKEAEKFWPVFNLYTHKIQTLKMSLEGGLQRKIEFAGGIENITDEQAQKLIDDVLISEQKIAKNKIKMIHELSKVISAKKIIRLRKADREFNRRILEEFGKRKRLRGGQ